MLAQKADNLTRLLKDPEPGLFTWAGAVSGNMQVLADWWDGKLKGWKP